MLLVKIAPIRNKEKKIAESRTKSEGFFFAEIEKKYILNIFQLPVFPFAFLHNWYNLLATVCNTVVWHDFFSNTFYNTIIDAKLQQ